MQILEQVEGLCKLAVRMGVEKVVLLAGRGEPQVHPAEEAVRRCGAAWTILECAFFAFSSVGPRANAG